jgi:hypothetical protein
MVARPGAVELALLADLQAFSAEVRAGPLAEVALGLARRLDADPVDRDRVALSRELRLIRADLRGEVASGDGELERFLASVEQPTFRGPGD